MYTQTTHDCHGRIIKHESEKCTDISRNTEDHIYVQIMYLALTCMSFMFEHVGLEGSGLGSILIDGEVDLTAAGAGRGRQHDSSLSSLTYVGLTRNSLAAMKAVHHIRNEKQQSKMPSPDLLPKCLQIRRNIEPISMTYIPLNINNSHTKEGTTIDHSTM
jgi:hypothetical protein